MNAPQVKKAFRCCSWFMAARIAQFPAFPSVRPTVPPGRQAASRYFRVPRPQRNPQWRYQPGAKAHGTARLDEPGEPCLGRTGTDRVWPSGHDATKFPEGLRPFCLHVVPAGLRFQEVRRTARCVPDDRFHGARPSAWSATHRNVSCDLAPCEENTFSVPATERSKRRSFRGGTKTRSGQVIPPHFVPRRNKVGRFRVPVRSVAGHLYREPSVATEMAAV